MVTYRSVSQVKQYRACPYCYYLGRIVRAWSRPAAWLPQGTAVHKAAEEWERSDRTMTVAEAQDIFRESYSLEVGKLTEITPNFQYWFSSGRYHGESDLERRYGIGLEQVAAYISYYRDTAPQEVIWHTPDGTPAIELPFDVMIGDVKARGVIDQVIEVTHPDGRVEIRVRDIKTGTKPGDVFQLKTYSFALHQLFGVDTTTGDFWMGKQGKPTKVTFDLSAMPDHELIWEYEDVDAAILAEVWEPGRDFEGCGLCSFIGLCPYCT